MSTELKPCPLKSGQRMSRCVNTCAWWDREEKQCILFTIADNLKGGVT